VKKSRKKERIAVALSEDEVRSLRKIVRSGIHNARAITRARILLLSHDGKTNREIVAMVGCSPRGVTNVRERYRDRGSAGSVLDDAPRPGQPKKILPAHEAFVIATACTDAPEGHDHWTLEALKGKLLATYDDLESVSHEWIRQMLIRAALKPWREKNVVHPKAHARVSGAHG